MHIFLQGPKNIGKSTVIRKTLDILSAEAHVKIGGFFTWNGGRGDPHVYIQKAALFRPQTVPMPPAHYDPQTDPMPPAHCAPQTAPMPPAHVSGVERFCIADYDERLGRLVSHPDAFEQHGVRFLRDNSAAGLIIMDELGFLESGANEFMRAVIDTVLGTIPVFGVLRLGDVPWHDEIKKNPLVRLVDVNEQNRDILPRELAAELVKLFSIT